MAIITLLGSLGLVATAQREADRVDSAAHAAHAARAARLEWWGGMLLVVSFVGLGFSLAQTSV